MQIDSMSVMTNVQIRDLPDDVHRRLKAQAALSGQSLNDFLRDRVTEIARVPTIAELAERVQRREPYVGPSSATVIREGRDAR
jgi:plasmid stability protein